MGTPGYMAPEQARGELVDARADVFALGSILAAILTGQPAFVGTTVYETIAKAAAADLADVQQRLAACGADAELLAIARRCLAARPEERYADGREVASAVAAYRATVEARLRQAETAAAEALVREAEQRKRRRLAVAAGSGIAAVLLVGLAVSLGLMHRAMLAEEQAKANEQQALANAQLAQANEQQAELRRREADEQRQRAERAAQQERQARIEAAGRLIQIKLIGDSLLDVFSDIDLRRVKSEAKPLEVVLADQLIRTGRKLDEESIRDPLMLANLRLRLVQTLLSLGRAKEAIEFAVAAYETCQKLLGADHYDTLVSMNTLAMVYRDAGQLAKALPLWEQCLTIRKAKLGPDHPATLQSMNNLALGYHAAGQLAKALPLSEETVKLRQAKLGFDHPDTLQSMNNLAASYQAAGQFNKALPLLEETVKLRQAKLGPDHPDTLDSMANLAAGYRATGQLAKALPLYEETLKLMQAKLGPDHPDTLQSMNNLARGYQTAGQLAKALPLYEETLKLRQAKLGPDHPSTLTSMANLALGYKAAGQLVKGLRFQEQAAQGIEKLRFQHEHARGILANTIRFYEQTKQFEQAQSWRQKWLDHVKATAGADSLDYANELAEHGQNLLVQKEWSEAERLLRECLAIRQKHLGAGDPGSGWLVFNTMSLLGGALLGQQKYAEAEPLLVKGYEGLKAREKEPATDADRLALRQRLGEALDRLIELYSDTNQTDEVTKYRELRANYPRPKPLDLSPKKGM
jgi:hypothetical protein